ncbi:hypothetical protein BB560_003239 [Smittium megazygosporum]|uniref:Uncharacterized protein n=1 Tax=Smittium megazygosporum TaxID=133381 RepID=A0A2T9ZCN4_9FUNG|nr:hypothetical protein BB560_003239 [Smittium megazygosporum]
MGDPNYNWPKIARLLDGIYSENTKLFESVQTTKIEIIPDNWKNELENKIYNSDSNEKKASLKNNKRGVKDNTEVSDIKKLISTILKSLPSEEQFEELVSILKNNDSASMGMKIVLERLVAPFNSISVNKLLSFWSNTGNMANSSVFSPVECDIIKGIIQRGHNLDSTTILDFTSCLKRVVKANADSKNFGNLVFTFTKKYGNKVNDECLEMLKQVANDLNSVFKKTTINIINKIS